MTPHNIAWDDLVTTVHLYHFTELEDCGFRVWVRLHWEHQHTVKTAAHLILTHTFISVLQIIIIQIGSSGVLAGLILFEKPCDAISPSSVSVWNSWVGFQCEQEPTTLKDTVLQNKDEDLMCCMKSLQHNFSQWEEKMKTLNQKPMFWTLGPLKH